MPGGGGPGNPCAPGKSPEAESSSATVRKITDRTPAGLAPGPKSRRDENGNG